MALVQRIIFKRTNSLVWFKLHRVILAHCQIYNIFDCNIRREILTTTKPGVKTGLCYSQFDSDYCYKYNVF